MSVYNLQLFYLLISKLSVDLQQLPFLSTYIDCLDIISFDTIFTIDIIGKGQSQAKLFWIVMPKPNTNHWQSRFRVWVVCFSFFGCQMWPHHGLNLCPLKRRAQSFNQWMARGVPYSEIFRKKLGFNGRISIRITGCLEDALGSGGAVVKNPPSNSGHAGDTGLIYVSGRSPGEGNGNPLQYSCLESPMDRGACWATVHGVAESGTTEHACLRLLTWWLERRDKAIGVSEINIWWQKLEGPGSSSGIVLGWGL